MSKIIAIVGLTLCGGAALAYGIVGYTLPLAHPEWFWGVIYFVTTICCVHAFVFKSLDK